MNKKALTETDVRTKLSTPAVVGENGCQAGLDWERDINLGILMTISTLLAEQRLNRGKKGAVNGLGRPLGKTARRVTRERRKAAGGSGFQAFSRAVTQMRILE
ncbi:hypothetical protein [Haloferula sp. BvORR071]|uniref:hypothetical protein n=1 Tax=Haloferula sp. BvORR071 TaxID=1396141 RepID=UPI002240EECD|nr:hypothetical protein [Haloferula sp. BvORR071]